jgi:hypothetical protein
MVWRRKVDYATKVQRCGDGFEENWVDGYIAYVVVIFCSGGFVGSNL